MIRIHRKLRETAQLELRPGGDTGSINDEGVGMYRLIVMLTAVTVPVFGAMPAQASTNQLQVTSTRGTSAIVAPANTGVQQSASSWTDSLFVWMQTSASSAARATAVAVAQSPLSYTGATPRADAARAPPTLRGAA